MGTNIVVMVVSMFLPIEAYLLNKSKVSLWVGIFFVITEITTLIGRFAVGIYVALPLGIIGFFCALRASATKNVIQSLKRPVE